MLAHANGFGEKGIGSCVSVEAFGEIALYFRLYRLIPESKQDFQNLTSNHFANSYNPANSFPMSTSKPLPRFLLWFWLATLILSAWHHPSKGEDVLSKETLENWLGWMESPKQHLRIIVQVQRSKEGRSVSGSILSPDQSPDAIPLPQFQIGEDGTWSFSAKNSNASSPTANFLGKQTSSESVEGTISLGKNEASLTLQKAGSLTQENQTNLGADSVWLGTLDVAVRKLDFRIRIYSRPPFGTSDSPRVLFDSLSQNAIGIPAQASIDEDRRMVFDIPTISAKYVANLDETGSQLDGKFIQGPLPLTLVMNLLADDATKTKEPSSIESKPYIERAFEVTSGNAFIKTISKVKEKSQGASGKPETIRLSGTLTLPKRPEGKPSGKFPAVVMVTGSGPQDRNETIGRHKPFEVIAHFLAENGMASLRYDDRGVGASTGDFLDATTKDFAEDALALWKYACSLPELDASKIGILGHSEGGLVGPMAAAWEPNIAFLILLAPPGITGSEVLSSQIDRMSELQGMSRSDRAATMRLQQKLQDIAGGYFADDASMKREILLAIKQNWDGLKQIAQAQNPTANPEDLKADLTSQIESQFKQLKTPWFRYFLNYNPATNWMLMRCPTLAIWGSNDVQILPELNREKLLLAVERNQQLDASLVVIPGLNHLMQTCQTGLPEEYDQIEETVSPKALRVILDWAEDQGILER